MKRILETVIKYGARPAEPGEFTKRAFLNGRIDLSQAESVIDVISAKNEFALKSSMKQLSGAVSDAVKEIRGESVCGVFSLITLNLRSSMPMRSLRGISSPEVESYRLAR